MESSLDLVGLCLVCACCQCWSCYVSVHVCVQVCVVGLCTYVCVCACVRLRSFSFVRLCVAARRACMLSVADTETVRDFRRLRVLQEHFPQQWQHGCTQPAVQAKTARLDLK